MNLPLRLAVCSLGVLWVNVDILRNVSWAFVEYSQHIRNPFEMYSRSVRNVFIICMLHNRHSKVWFLQCKSMVFGVQLIKENGDKSKFVQTY